MMDGDIFFYIGLFSYVIFMVIFEYLNFGDNCVNICFRGSVIDVFEDFYNLDFEDEGNV